jgi:hypothetical protein
MRCFYCNCKLNGRNDAGVCPGCARGKSVERSSVWDARCSATAITRPVAAPTAMELAFQTAEFATRPTNK